MTHPSRKPRLLPALQGLCLSLLLTSLTPTQAQLRNPDAPSVVPRIPGARLLSNELKLAGSPTTADYIVAVVDQELITHTDVDKRVARIQDTAPPGSKLPPDDELRRQVLDALIDEKVQLSHARAIGLGVTEVEIDGAIENIASQNKLTLREMQRRMEADGLDYPRYRASLREQILLQRLRDREVNARIQISDSDLDAFLATDPAAQTEVALNVAHILIPVPEQATPAQIETLQAKARQVHEQARIGGNFNQLARTHSADTRTKDQGGAFGMMPVSRLPDLFVSAVRNLKVGEVAPLVRSNAGFHIVKLTERENSAEATYTQQRSRHILLRSTPQESTQDQVARMTAIRKDIVGGSNSFAQMARQHSQDGSAANGGELGWASPGQFVPEFERALTALQAGEISQPVVSRFGVHLIQLIDRREVKLSDAQKREAARSVLRERRFESAYEDWARELRAAAWVEMRDEP
jgi:peptidyl-prolyl cis-trans isomerase SurA